MPSPELLFDFEVTIRATVRDIAFEAIIACAHCPYVTMSFWSPRDAERDFCQHFHAKHQK